MSLHMSKRTYASTVRSTLCTPTTLLYSVRLCLLQSWHCWMFLYYRPACAQTMPYETSLIMTITITLIHFRSYKPPATGVQFTTPAIQSCQELQHSSQHLCPQQLHYGNVQSDLQHLPSVTYVAGVQQARCTRMGSTSHHSSSNSKTAYLSAAKLGTCRATLIFSSSLS